MSDLESKVGNNYPDPSNSYTTLPYTLKKDANVNILIYDITGKQVYSQKVKGHKGENEQRIDISDLPSGQYVLNVISGFKRIGTEEFIKEERK